MTTDATTSSRGSCTFNGMKFEPLHGVRYKHDYIKIAQDIKAGRLQEKPTLRSLFKKDLWALLYFGMQVTPAVHPFWVRSSREVNDGPKTDTIDLWSRDHGKSTIITIGESVQDIFNDPNIRIAIYSYTKDTAGVFFGQIRDILERNEFLRWLFDDICWAELKSSPQWNDNGIVVNRSKQLKECTVEAWGLTTGMPTGRHFDKLVFDDIVTLDLVRNPNLMQLSKDCFDMAQFTRSGSFSRRRVIGTFYHHDDVLVYVCGLKKLDGSPMFHIRRKPATEDGTYNGKPVLLTQEALDQAKTNRKFFATQMLLDPTPKEDGQLPWDQVKYAKPGDLPERTFKFMVVDPAKGFRADGREPDSLAMWVVAVDPFINDLGASRVYIVDGFLGVVPWEEGLKELVNMFLRNGWIHRLGVEDVGQDTKVTQVESALRARGRAVSVENGMLIRLKPSKRSKEERIDANLGAPLRTGLVSMLETVPVLARNRLKEEMERYPMWKDDGVDALSYVWDILKEFRFPTVAQAAALPEKPKDLWQRIEERQARRAAGRHWMLG